METQAERCRRWRRENPEKAKASIAKWIAANREKYLAGKLEREKKRREAHGRQPRSENEKRRRREYERARRAADPKVRLNVTVGNEMRRLIARGTKNGRSWRLLVGYSVGDLKRHLERQFRDGMSWDNYGDWHVDHILPSSSFAFTTPDDPGFRACWALSNLRPLWRADNIRKRNQRTHLI